MGSSESSERNNGDNNITKTKDQERKDELKDSAKVAGAVAGVAAAAAYGECSILASINNKKEEDGATMKAPGQNGLYIKRKDFEDDPAGYFKGIRGNGNPHFRGAKSSINNNEEEVDGPVMKVPSKKGVYIKRKDFVDDPVGYFKGTGGK